MKRFLTQVCPIFTTKEQLDPIIEAIEKEARSLVPDVSTRKGRDAIASMAHKVDYLSIPGYVWLNPPYSDITPFVKKAAAESVNQIGTVMLVPADTSVGWFKEAIQTASEVRFITAGRLAFINPVTGKPVSGNNKGSMLIIWRPYPRTHCHFATVDREELMAFGVKLLARREAA